MNEILIILGAAASGIALIAMLGATFFIVEQRTIAIVQRLGRYARQAGPGMRAKIPFIERVAGRINLRVQQIDVKVETKTADDIFVRMVIAVQYYILPERAFDAFYKLDHDDDDAIRQITSCVLDVVRGRVSKIRLNGVFEKKEEIDDLVKHELAQAMYGFGYAIAKVLVIDIDPDARVKDSMNEINAAQRMRLAATEKGEADRILKVKAAEGDAESKALQGRAIVDQQKAIMAGLRDSVSEFRRSVPGTTANEVMNLVLMTQYFEVLKEIGVSSRSNAILIPHSPSSFTRLTEQMRSAFMEPSETVKATDARTEPTELSRDLTLPFPPNVPANGGL